MPLNTFCRCSTEVERDGIWEVHTLLIKDVQVEDGGDYHVKATNRVGATEETGKLSIVTEEPSFPKTLDSVTTKLGCTESFEVISQTLTLFDLLDQYFLTFCGLRIPNKRYIVYCLGLVKLGGLVLALPNRSH